MYRKSVQWVFFFMLVGVSVSMAEVKEWVGKVEVSFHVAPDGNDNYEGTKKRPFASFERARDAVRNLGPEITGDILIEIAPGDYFREQTLVLEPQDSGRGNSRVVYRGGGIPGSARLVGGNKITDWESVDGSIFRVKVDPEVEFNTLYENGVRSRKARFPNYEYQTGFPQSDYRWFRSADGTPSTLIWEDGDLDRLRQFDLLGDGACLVFHPWAYCDWTPFTRRITEIDFDLRRITVPGDDPNIGRGARFYIEGSHALLDQPGEFFLDRRQGFLYYWPRFGTPAEQEIIIPTVTRIIELAGNDVETPVRNISIEGLTLACTDTYGIISGTSHFVWEPSNTLGSAGDGAHGALHLRYTEEINVQFNSFQSLGACAVYLERSNKRNRIYGNWIRNVRVSGIVLAPHRERRQFPRDVNEENRIENNVIHSIGVDGGAGINFWGGRANLIRHCEIFDGSRHGVSIRGNFAQLNPSNIKRGIPDTNRPLAEENRVEYTHVYRMGQDSGDMGAVHMAGISGRDIHPVNYLEQLLIENAPAHPSMLDVPPNGIFLDYTEGVVGQILKDIDIRGPGTPFRTNRTDFRHVYDNCSWRAGFDHSRMEYDRIGRLDDFPSNYGSPEEIQDPIVRAIDEGLNRELEVSWRHPEEDFYNGVWIYAEGEQDYSPVFVPAPDSIVRIPRPSGNRLVKLRMCTVNKHSNRSNGVLIPAAEISEPISNLHARGINEGVELSWNDPEKRFSHLLVHIDPKEEPVRVEAGEEKVRLDELSNGQVYTVRMDVVDTDGHAWSGTELRCAAGPGASIPMDLAAWWTLEVEASHEGLSVFDDSGKGNTLFVGSDTVAAVEGRFGQALRFDGESSFVRVLDASALQIGAEDDFSISLWIKRSPSSAMNGRIFDFGGGLLGAWEHWGKEIEAAPSVGISLIGSDSGFRAVFNDGTKTHRAERQGLGLIDCWTHVVVNLNRKSRLALWVNGQCVADVDVSAADRKNMSGEEFWFGRFRQDDHPNLFWSGAIDQVRVYRRALTPAEIQALAEENHVIK